MRAHGIVLAAGRSSRAGTRKALARVDGQPMLARALATLSQGGCELLTVVAGDDASALAAHAGVARVVKNERVDDGMLRSLQLGLADAKAEGAEVAVVALIDHPHVQGATVRAILGRPRAGTVGAANSSAANSSAANSGAANSGAANSGAAFIAAHLGGAVPVVVFPSYQGQRGHPFALNAPGFDVVLRAQPWAKTNEVLEGVASLEVPVDDAAVVQDLDTAEQLSRAGVHPV